eukprot:jgi/Chrzof1/11682/Cz06g05080.t1
MLSKCMHGSPCIMHYALCMAVHASITLISQHGLSSHYYCMCYYVISVMHYISNASAIHHSSAGYARQLHYCLLQHACSLTPKLLLCCWLPRTNITTKSYTCAFMTSYCVCSAAHDKVAGCSCGSCGKAGCLPCHALVQLASGSVLPAGSSASSQLGSSMQQQGMVCRTMGKGEYPSLVTVQPHQ